MELKSNLNLRLFGEVSESIVDGPGFRYSIFVQGCHHHCEGCHNPNSHSFSGGYVDSVENVLKRALGAVYCNGITLSGGEPFCQAKPLWTLSKALKENNKNIMIYTGYTLEELVDKDDENINGLLSMADILVDGKFVKGLRDLTLLYRGSSNQRVIDMNKTRENGKITLFC